MGMPGIPPEGCSFAWDVSPYQQDSFFDIYLDVNTDFSNPPVFEGTPIPAKTYFQWHCSALMTEQTYYWFVRYSYYVDQVLHHIDSAVGTFTTGTSLIPQMTISGTVVPAGPLYNPSGVWMTCPGACVPATLSLNYSGSYSFKVYAGGNYTVTPAYGGFYFNPLNRSYTNVQTNFTNQNFWMISARPNPACQPIPGANISNVSVSIGNLQWNYVQDPAYSAPNGFNVYFPATTQTPVYVAYPRSSAFSIEIPNLYYNTVYSWKAVPVNESGEAEGVETWDFTTEALPTDTPGLIEPEDRASGIPTQNAAFQWSLPDGDYQVDSFFDVYCDINPGFPNPPTFSGHLDPLRTYFEWHCAALMTEQTYYWFVRYSYYVDQVLHHFDSAVNTFTTAVSQIQTSIISGTIIPASPLFNPSGVWITCPGAVIPATLNTNFSGVYSFMVYNGGSYTVTPSKVGFYFNPLTRPYTNVQGNFTNQNFWMISARPNPACQPVPGINASGVSVSTGHLSWSFIPDAAYSEPTGFNVYFPASSQTPVYVPYAQRSFFDIEIPVLEYFTEYEWKVVPLNTEGEAENIELWNFTTEEGGLPAPILTFSQGGILTWTPVPGALYYKVYRSVNPKGPWDIVHITGELAWYDVGMPPDRAFYYVTAVNEPAEREKK